MKYWRTTIIDTPLTNQANKNTFHSLKTNNSSGCDCASFQALKHILAWYRIHQNTYFLTVWTKESSERYLKNQKGAIHICLKEHSNLGEECFRKSSGKVTHSSQKNLEKFNKTYYAKLFPGNPTFIFRYMNEDIMKNISTRINTMKVTVIYTLLVKFLEDV